MFLGCGHATRLHSKTLTGFQDKVNCYYASRDIEKAKGYNQKYRGHGYFDSYEAAINDNNIDVVLIATPPVQHLEQTLASLQAGKHVIVEKPPFLKASDFHKIRASEKKNKRKVLVAENYFYKPLAFKLRELISANVVGEILFVHINALKQQTIKDWRGDAKMTGGGALFEGGIHWINLIANLGLKVKSVHGHRPGPKENAEKSILVAVEYEEGAVGSFYYSWETPSLFKGLRISKIYGREGSITFESNGIFMIVRGKKKRIIFPGLKDIAGYKEMFRDFIESIQHEKEPQFTLDLAEQDLTLIERIYKSIKN